MMRGWSPDHITESVTKGILNRSRNHAIILPALGSSGGGLPDSGLAMKVAGPFYFFTDLE
jgi:hypothetical protein